MGYMNDDDDEYKQGRPLTTAAVARTLKSHRTMLMWIGGSVVVLCVVVAALALLMFYKGAKMGEKMTTLATRARSVWQKSAGDIEPTLPHPHTDPVTGYMETAQSLTHLDPDTGLKY